MFRAPLPNWVIHVHGAAFTLWIFLLIVQTSLVSAGRVDIHRRLGILVFGLACAMVILGTMAATDLLRRGVAAQSVDAKTFYASSLGDIVIFGTLIFFAFRTRSNPAAHKRLILIATITLLAAAINRWPFPIILREPILITLIDDAFLLPLVAYDLWSLPPEQETPAAAPTPHRSWHGYLSFAAVSCIALVIVAMLLWIIRRWGARLVSSYRAFASRRRESEAACWRRFKHACNRNEASQSYALLLACLRRLHQAMTLDEFQRQAADANLDQQITILSSTLFGAKRITGWKGPALYAAVARHRRVPVSTEAVAKYLPALNPD